MGSDWADLVNRIVDGRGSHALRYGNVQHGLAVYQHPSGAGRQQGRRIRLFHSLSELPGGHGTGVVGLGHGVTVIVGQV